MLRNNFVSTSAVGKDFGIESTSLSYSKKRVVDHGRRVAGSLAELYMAPVGACSCTRFDSSLGDAIQ